MPKKRSQKFRTELRKNRAPRARAGDLTRQFHQAEESLLDAAAQERVSGKGELSRRRTVIAGADDQGEMLLDIDDSVCQAGRVLSVHGLTCFVESDGGRRVRCVTRRLLKTLATDQRHLVVAGDRVQFRPAGTEEGIIERVEPRSHSLCRTSRGKRHVLVANVDLLLIVTSAAEPALKPNLIDRLLATAERDRIAARLVINKIDLVDPAQLAPLAGVYAQMGYPVHLVSAQTGAGICALREVLRCRASCLAGQSGVGKSSLLNAVEPGLALRVSSVSLENQKGRHTTTSASLIRLQTGGWVVDTPGIRQFQLWDLAPAEIAGLYRDLRPFVSRCRYPNCTHTHEQPCGVKDAVADELLDARRYESYCQVLSGDEP